MQTDIAILTVIPKELRWAKQVLDIKPGDPGAKNRFGTKYWSCSTYSHMARLQYRARPSRSAGQLRVRSRRVRRNSYL